MPRLRIITLVPSRAGAERQPLHENYLLNVNKMSSSLRQKEREQLGGVYDGEKPSKQERRVVVEKTKCGKLLLSQGCACSAKENIFPEFYSASILPALNIYLRFGDGSGKFLIRSTCSPMSTRTDVMKWNKFHFLFRNSGNQLHRVHEVGPPVDRFHCLAREICILQRAELLESICSYE